MNDDMNDIPISARRNFLIKVNASDAPGGIGKPKDSSQWEGSGAFSTKPPIKSLLGRKLPTWQSEPPRPGDRLYVWINELRGGYGLTATADVDKISKDSTELRILPSNVMLLPNGVLNNKRLDELEAPDNVYYRIRRSTVAALRFLSDKDAEEIDAEIAKFRVGSESAVIFGPDANYEIERRRRLGEIASRPGQRQFSETIRRNYGSKCAVTGCRVAEALEAAHIRTVERSDNNDPINGILLRADIHALLDAFLITFTPDGKGIEVGPDLTDPTYEMLHQIEVAAPVHGPRPASAHIEHHRACFRQRNSSGR
jgi:hypothetical protein